MEKVWEREEEGRRFIGQKLKRRVLVGLRGGPSTPPPTWRLHLSSPSPSPNAKNDAVPQFLHFPASSTVSARKLCANLWEFQPYHHIHTPLPHMNIPLTGIRLRRRRRRRRKDEPSHTLSDQLASPVKHCRPSEKNDRDLQPVSPASYSGSMEVAPVNPTSSALDFKGRRMGESSYNLKTSKELLKVLNRIWSLEEQHSSSISVMRALKMELDLSRSRVKELVQEKQLDRQEMEDLMKHMTEDKLVKKSKERDEFKAAFQSVKEELEDERRLRKHSESLHRKLARELSEMKSSFTSSLRELERERKARILLENLCDEFAKGIRAYEQEVRSIRKSKSEKGQASRDLGLDRLVLHISEAWLDERTQMKVDKAGDNFEESSIVDKLGFDIETFLHAKRSIHLKNYGNSSPKELREIYPCRHSLDSFPLKEAISAPLNMAEEDSIVTNFYDKKFPAGGKVSSRLQNHYSAEVHQKDKSSRNSRRKQVQSEEFTEANRFHENVGHRNMSCDESWFVERKPSEMRGDNNTALLNDPEVSTIWEATQGPHESERPKNMRMNSIHRLDSLSSEGDKIHPESICREDSCVQSIITGNGSPVVEQWKSKLSVPDLSKHESFSRLPKGVKENTLMAKLLEARLEGQKSRSLTPELAKALLDEPGKFQMRKKLECE
ncbi:hypothetical protein G2W53_017287 [Senna tora]|uniref:Uncharacterized protein n=1 Tax=Senna tora TaxID=362788 RepID=A0A834TNZ4_9FABA|nr:hypothetical protein G2W53_017287 [Senna tora]